MSTLGEKTEPTTRRRQPAVAAVACGVVGVLAAVWIYWLILPGMVLGIAAVVLGLRARRDGAGERGSVAMALGIVAVLLVPSLLMVAEMERDYARNCALNPTDTGC